MWHSVIIGALWSCGLQLQQGPFGPVTFGHNKGPSGMWPVTTKGTLWASCIYKNIFYPPTSKFFLSQKTFLPTNIFFTPILHHHYCTTPNINFIASPIPQTHPSLTKWHMYAMCHPLMWLMYTMNPPMHFKDFSSIGDRQIDWCTLLPFIFRLENSGHYVPFFLAPPEGFEDHWGIISWNTCNCWPHQQHVAFGQDRCISATAGSLWLQLITTDFV